ncbi:MAG: hypothetical protein A2Y24_00735 [Clostridiales bacterium GWE2_32_10]|nr:MAG: hypothetical protein A2Y24_00735 [Clostridiales bacterium GWE2_32_10]HBY20157.1 SAM-dependent methyltransferase [Clostridiales bacterium]
MRLSKRLLTIAGKVLQGSNIIDVGTDHGYVPIYLYETKVINKAIAADVSYGSCEKARQNIIEHSLENYILVVESDGLKGIDTKGFDTIVISGMGGRLICGILDDGIEKLKNIEYLVLQPQTEIASVRKKLHSIGYKIIDEDILLDDGKYYNIIVGKKGKEVYDKDIDYLFGKRLLDRKDAVLKEFLEFEVLKLRGIIGRIKERG